MTAKAIAIESYIALHGIGSKGTGKTATPPRQNAGLVHAVDEIKDEISPAVRIALSSDTLAVRNPESEGKGAAAAARGARLKQGASRRPWELHAARGVRAD
jgi:hypothetical protein